MSTIIDSARYISKIEGETCPSTFLYSLLYCYSETILQEEDFPKAVRLIFLWWR